MSLNSLAAARTRRPAGRATPARAKPTKTSDKPCARARLSRPGLLGGRTAPKSTSRTFAIDDRRETNPHSNPLEVRCDADAVRSVPRV
jgi:hypothetical protein